MSKVGDILRQNKKLVFFLVLALILFLYTSISISQVSATGGVVALGSTGNVTVVGEQIFLLAIANIAIGILIYLSYHFHERKNKKGNAGLDFLLTYGWAFIAVLVVISSFYNGGPLGIKAKGLLPQSCEFNYGRFDCTRFSANETMLMLEIENVKDNSVVTYLEIYPTDKNVGPCESRSAETNLKGNGKDQFYFTCKNLGEVGDWVKFDIVARYAIAGKVITQTADGIVAVRIKNTLIDISSSNYDGDGDGLSDNDERNIYGTNPIWRDSDRDKVDDGDEVWIGTDPMDDADYPTCAEFGASLGLETFCMEDECGTYDDCLEGIGYCSDGLYCCYGDCSEGDGSCTNCGGGDDPVVPVCGDEKIEGDEECESPGDNPQLNGAECADWPEEYMPGGALDCNTDCSFNFDDCVEWASDYCSDGTLYNTCSGSELRKGYYCTFQRELEFSCDECGDLCEGGIDYCYDNACQDTLCGNDKGDPGEECDRGEENGVACSAPCDGECEYCDDDCTIVIKEGFTCSVPGGGSPIMTKDTDTADPILPSP